MAFGNKVNSTSAEGEKGKMVPEETVQVQSMNPSSDLNDIDCEKHGASRESNPMPDLKRKLRSRHLQMIAIGESCWLSWGSFPFLLLPQDRRPFRKVTTCSFNS